MKKEQIIEAARNLFHQFGFKKVSMDEIQYICILAAKKNY